MNTLISIIVPVYKTEPYLQKCLQSIVNQTYRNLEIILVDDGSPDRCPQICDEWAKKDSRISVIHQENSGLGKARNSGIEKAKGSYLAFVDSDDEIEPDMYEKLLAAAESCKADICYCGCKDVSSKGVVAGTPPLKFSYKGDEIRTEFIPQVLGTLPSDRHTVFCGVSSTSALYHAALLQKAGIRFLSERSDNISEDLDFNLKTCCHAEIIQIIPDTPYLYIKREINSLTSSYRSDRFEMVKKLYR
ncbi:MAG: glycosyltransferase [Oscillospiraceae bacterium]|nr:glycosyltransferase [Oscillospiraceae bacterium]